MNLCGVSVGCLVISSRERGRPVDRSEGDSRRTLTTETGYKKERSSRSRTPTPTLTLLGPRKGPGSGRTRRSRYRRPRLTLKVHRDGTPV